jgi:hypothetical protein
MHLMMVEAGRNMQCSDDVLKSLTIKILKLDVCCIKDGGENWSKFYVKECNVQTEWL